jgi:UDPglucose 6-dehydrogenase
VIVPTPSDNRGAFSLQYATFAFRELGKALREKRDYHLIVLTSTVLPGATRFGLLPVLERESGKKCGPDFGLCYSPEFIALGSVIRDFLSPDFNLIGEFDERSGAFLEACYAQVMLNNAPARRMSIENAELTKIAVNTYVTTKVTFANMLADICEHLPGGDVDVVTAALGSDSRIGRKYLTGALGYGGPCFPRDNLALGFLARSIGTSAEIAEATNHCNCVRVDKVLQRLHSLLRPGSNVAVLGLAYKPDSHVIEESQGIILAKALSRNGARVVGYDPLANAFARAELRDHAVILDSLHECLRQCEVVLITTPDAQFRKLKAEDFTAASLVTVVDFWRVLADELRGKPNICYIGAGQSSNDEENCRRLSNMWGAAAAAGGKE